MYYTPDQPLTPPEEEGHSYQEWAEATRGHELYNDDLEFRIDDRITTALWDEDTKHEFGVALPMNMSNGEMKSILAYLDQYQPSVPYSEVKNPTQKQISTFIRKVCNL